MDCSHCGQTNPEGARFCMACGSRLALACPDCGAELPAGARFCGQCGRPVQETAASAAMEPSPAPSQSPPASAPASGSTLEQYIPRQLMQKLEAARRSGSGLGERRVVTILFCDLKGSTAAAQDLDPEDWADIMNGAFQHLIAPVYRYEGTLARLMGDAILAFFGAPITHEDDPQRAVLAGLEILERIQPYRRQVQEEWQLEFDVRVGIHTGLVLVGEVGSDLRVEYTAMGDAVNVAARMEQTAAPGTLQISDAVHRLVGPLFETEDLGDIELKGKREPVRVYRVLAARAEPGRLRGIAGLDAPLIGRERELAVLQSAVQAVMDGRGQAVSVIGEAGLGKSRLTAELRNSLEAEGQFEAGLSWFEGRCLSYQTEAPFTPFIDLLSTCFELTPGMNDSQRWEQLLSALEAHAPDLVDDRAPFLASLLDIPVPGEAAARVTFLEPPELRERIFDSVVALIEHLADGQPLVLALEDLHWSDGSSMELLQRLLSLTARRPVMLLSVFRPDHEAECWSFHQQALADFPQHYQAVELEPLDESGARSLIGSLLEVEGLPDEVRQVILARAEGNPFYIEEVIRSLIDEGAIEQDGTRWRATDKAVSTAVPASLNLLLTARLDRLDEPVRQVAQTAAVIGRQFPVDLLAHLDGLSALDPALSDLEERGLVWEKARLPSRIYQFKHALTQEAAYRSLTRRRRRQLHGQVADRLLEVEPERVAEIAHHYWEARQRRDALPHLIAAGERAARSYAAPEAIRWFSRAMEVVDEVDDAGLARRLYEGHGGVLRLVGRVPEAVEIYQAMLAFAERTGDASMRISALNKLAMTDSIMMGQLETIENYLEPAEGLANEHDDVAGLSETSLLRCMKCTLSADFAQAEELMGNMASVSRELEVGEVLAMSLHHVATSQLYLCRYDEAWETVQNAVQVAQEAGDLFHESLDQPVIASIQLRNGRVDLARKAAERGLAIGREIGAGYAMAPNAVLLAQLAQTQGDFEAALRYNQELIEIGKLGPTSGWGVPVGMAGMGTVQLQVGSESPAAVQETHMKVKEMVQGPFAPVFRTFIWMELGFCALQLGDFDMAAEVLERGVSEPGLFMNLLRPQLRVGLAQAALGRGELDEAAHQLGLARAQAEESAMRHVLPFIALVEGLVAEARGEDEAALEHLVEAAGGAAPLKFRPLLWQIRRAKARILSRSGRHQEAAVAQAGAVQMLQDMADLLTDDELRAGFLRNHLGL